MNKPRTSLPVLFALSLSCSSSAQTGTKSATATAAVVPSSELVGSWMMSSTSYVKVHRVSKTETSKETVTSQCNVCPKITFNADGTGFIKTSNGNISSNRFSWKVSGGKLSFTNSILKSGSALASGIYKIMHSEGNTIGSELVLVDSKNTEQTISRLD